MTGLALAFGVATGAAFLAPAPASAMQIGAAAGAISGQQNPMVEEIQTRRRGVRSNRRGRGPVAHRGRHRGGVGRGVAAGVGAAAVLGILGAAAAANAAPRDCYIQRQRVFDRWGNFAGYRDVQVCERY